MGIVPLGPGFAAEVRGVTLAEVAADDAAYAVVRAAFEEHSVLVFRGQVVTEPFDIPVGRLAVVADPIGNTLVLLDLSQGHYVTDAAGNVTAVTR